MTDADIVNVTRTREETLTKFVKWYRHYTIGGVKRPVQVSETIDRDILFNTVTMMDINIDV